MFRMLGPAFAAMITLAAQTSATAADRIRLAVQRTGTLAWELDVIRTHGLDRKLDLAIETIELASTEAGKIALKGGSADLMLSDWLWVARERSLGDNLVFYPSSSTLGAVMVPAQSPIREIVDLRGKKLAVAGGPLDKSWLLLQALARRDGMDLKKQATVVYGAPPLLSEKALQGETDATLTFWNANRPFQTSARLKFSNELRLLQERHEGTACGTLELFGVNHSVIVGIRSLEAFLDEREKFILVESSVVVGIGRDEILGVEPAA
jgi:ABC-type nitrate/sulfonate/bicarbonate transport system substrate-binding protein